MNDVPPDADQPSVELVVDKWVRLPGTTIEVQLVDKTANLTITRSADGESWLLPKVCYVRQKTSTTKRQPAQSFATARDFTAVGGATHAVRPRGLIIPGNSGPGF